MKIESSSLHDLIRNSRSRIKRKIDVKRERQRKIKKGANVSTVS